MKYLIFLSITYLFINNTIAQIHPLEIQTSGHGVDHTCQIFSLGDRGIVMSGDFEKTLSIEGAIAFNANGDRDVFWGMIDLDGGKVSRSQQLGGEQYDHISSVAGDTSGNLYVLVSFKRETNIGSQKLKSSGFMGSYIAKMDEKRGIRWVR
ncbi:MAG: hypothetical protein FJY10_06385 [Bacteroidetes bacterium]|nr:hypothetical protein [Bacteroidota bacterium]